MKGRDRNRRPIFIDGLFKRNKEQMDDAISFSRALVESLWMSFRIRKE